MTGDLLKRGIEQAYWPIYQLAPLIPATHLIFLIAGLGALTASFLGLTGKARWFAFALSLYLLGGAWLLAHALPVISTDAGW